MKKLLGQMLIEGGEISQEQLDEALSIQKEEGKLLGFIMVKLGYIDEDVLLDYLELQGTKINTRRDKKIKKKKYYS